ncbi:MAG: ATP-binding cassette domain-containing protein, partial [Synechococcales cyanobacterium]
MTTIPILQLDSLSKYFPHSPRPAIDQLTLSLSSGDILSLLGPSGCGKTTLLRLVAGFDSPTTGSIHLDGRLV